jgi:hypothetical protein
MTFLSSPLDSVIGHILGFALGWYVQRIEVKNAVAAVKGVKWQTMQNMLEPTIP